MVSVQPNCSFIAIDATEILVRSMYAIKTAALQSSTTVYHDCQPTGRTSVAAEVTGYALPVEKGHTLAAPTSHGCGEVMIACVILQP